MRATAALISTLLPPLLLTIAAPARGAGPEDSRPVAEYARATYGEATVETLADLVAFRTVHKEGTANAEHPPFRAMTRYLREKAAELGLEFADHGAVVVVSLGRSPERLGIVTHGDVQPADPSKWARDPFTLDATSEPGRLLGRGTEDDKGPIATALYAMGAVADRGVPLARRIELIVSYTEESDWEPFQAFLAERPPPDLNVALDSEYPVVVAEKGWGMVRLTLPPVPAAAASASSRPALESFTGGAFISQIPEDAEAVGGVAEPHDDDRAMVGEVKAELLRFGLQVAGHRPELGIVGVVDAVDVHRAEGDQIGERGDRRFAVALDGIIGQGAAAFRWGVPHRGPGGRRCGTGAEQHQREDRGATCRHAGPQPRPSGTGQPSMVHCSLLPQQVCRAHSPLTTS